ncbi:MAG: TadE family protein [Chloroflexota bacterium]
MSLSPPALRNRAQSMVEFALVLPLFLVLMLGFIDFSRLLFTYVSVANGAREMARASAVSYNWTAAPAVDAFNNSTIFAGPQVVTDTVTVSTGSCAAHAKGCTTSSTSVCTLPLKVATCTPALTAPPQDGFVQVIVNYTFQFNPLFASRLAGREYASFLRPTANVNTTVREYAE